MPASIRAHRAEVKGPVRRHRGVSISVFGSVAREDSNSESDIDFLVAFEPTSSLLDLTHLEEALQNLLGVDVDAVSAGALLYRDHEIPQDALPL